MHLGIRKSVKSERRRQRPWSENTHRDTAAVKEGEITQTEGFNFLTIMAKVVLVC